MPLTAQIKCITRHPRKDSHYPIMDIGGFTDKRWRISVEDAIDHIEAGTWEFYTLVQDRRRNVVVTARSGRKLLENEPEPGLPNDLLSLPECPDDFSSL